MIKSVGTLYAIQDLFAHLDAHFVARDEFLSGFNKYGSSTSEAVYETASELNWICTADNGQLVPTVIGRMAHQGVDRAMRLRFQLASIVEMKRPVWAALLPKGRKEAEAGLPPEIQQCFEEAALFGPADEEVVQWWDRLAGIMRETTQRLLTETGRRGEKLTLAFERERTLRPPLWQAVETNYAGYDVLSVAERDSEEFLKIEVKATERAFGQAEIHVTEHEWITASKSPDSYLFHVWLLNPTPSLFIVPCNVVMSHVPANQGKGRWRNVAIRLGAITHPSKAIKAAA